MATDNIQSLGAFETLFNKNVPHVLENIFFSLDFHSFLECRKVCKKWAELFTSESYRSRSKKLRNVERLCYHSMNGNVEEVMRLISIGVDPNCQRLNGRGGTALHYAASNGKGRVVKLLLDKGANPNTVNDVGATPLNEAARMIYTGVSRKLLEAGADPNIADEKGDFPLHRVVKHGGNCSICTDYELSFRYPIYVQPHCCDLLLIRMLIDAGADINKANHEGYTPLFIAVMRGRGHTDVVKKLIDAGAEPDKAYKLGAIPLEFVSSRAIAKLLQDGGAPPSKVQKRS